MDFSLPDETSEIVALARDFCKKNIEPISAKIDRESYFPKDKFAEMGKLGLLGLTVPEEYGGAGMNYLTEGAVLEEISYFSASVGLSYGAHCNLVIDNILRNGNKDQREEFIPSLVSGSKIGSLCLTEPGSGSDALGSMKTNYRKEGGLYIVNGSKTFITNAPVADVFIVYGRNGEEYSAFLLKREDGISTPRHIDKMGMRGSPTGEVVIDNVRVGPERLLLGEGKGRDVIYSGLNAERAVLAFGSLGIARRALDEAISYSNQRKQFGRKIGEFELIQEKIAYMFTKLEAARLLAYKAALMAEKDVKDPSYPAASILLASETATQIARDAIQIFGGYGYTEDYPLGRYLRDAILYEIGAGTNEIRKIVIARSVLKKGQS
ncbi:MAG: acyl-CoA dehydrogenase family protein [Thermoplasmatales archaeon]